MTCEVCFYETPEVTQVKSLLGNWSFNRCLICAGIEATPLNEIESRVEFGLPPNWIYYLTTYVQSPRSKGGQFLVYSEIT